MCPKCEPPKTRTAQNVRKLGQVVHQRGERVHWLEKKHRLQKVVHCLKKWIIDLILNRQIVHRLQRFFHPVHDLLVQVWHGALIMLVNHSAPKK
mmetsp:Transcript_41922/g.67409  ORF Transcript_41922/g.67409 Transcript_41922/m.67409 type:complete len:94 (-) Transcript_41922:214-495(-)